MEQLITAQEFASFRNISQKIGTNKINEAILLAQQNELQGLLGDFYFDVIQNKDTVEYQDLMNGGTFMCNGYEYEQAGIKRLLADYVYSRHIYNSNVNLTPFGTMIKETKDGSPADRNTLKDMSLQAQKDAGAKWRIIELYITSQPLKFKRYNEQYYSKKTNGFSTFKSEVL